MEDEIIEELRRVKDEIAKEHGYDVKRLVANLQKKTEARAKIEIKKNHPFIAEQIVRVD